MTVVSSPQRARRFGTSYQVTVADVPLEVLHFHNEASGESILAVFDPARSTRVTPYFQPPYSDAVEITIGTVNEPANLAIDFIDFDAAEVREQSRGRAQVVKGI